MILLIDNYDSFTYNLYQMVATQTQNVQVIRNDKISLAQIEAMAPQAIILSPGPGRPENAGICVELVRAFSGKLPILGVCLGHQAIVQAFGGDVIQSDSVVHGKLTHVFHTRAHIFTDMPLPFTAGRYHSLIADNNTLPDVLSVEAHSEQGIVMAVKHQTHDTFGVQFHPESILTPEGDTLIQHFLQTSLQAVA